LFISACVRDASLLPPIAADLKFLDALTGAAEHTVTSGR
jgi:hypothetical protein